MWYEGGGKGVRKKTHYRIVYADEIQCCFMPERGRIEAVFILRRKQVEYCVKRKKVVYMICGPRESF